MGTPAAAKKKSVVVAVDLAKKSRRDFLSGLFDQCNKRSDWRIHILQSQSELTPEIVQGWPSTGIDGVIIVEDGAPGTEKALAKSSVPAVVVGSRAEYLQRRTSNVVFLRIDDEAIGTYAAEKLSGLGAFNSAAFIPAGDNSFWSELRWRGFRTGFARRNIPVHTYREKEHENIKSFLSALPKPAAVFAACDRIAYEAISSIHDAKAIVPESLAILGVDNDELLCNSTRPRLSSICPDHYAEGAIAHRELDALMRARKKHPAKSILCAHCELAARESTTPVVPAASLISRALEFIGRQATRGISPNDVAAYLGISRRLLDLRFHQLHKSTVSHEILRVKLEAVKRLLAETDRGIAAITRTCGFANANYLKNVFSEKFGMGMREWRRNHAPSTSDSKTVGKHPTKPL